MAPMTHLELFRATVAHESTGHFLYYAGFTPDLERRVLEHYGAADKAELFRSLGVPVGAHVTVPERPDLPRHDYSRYYSDVALPPGTTLEQFLSRWGVLRLPGSSFHFTRTISPLRHATSLQEVERFPLPRPEHYLIDVPAMTKQVEHAHQEGRAAVCFTGHMYEEAWQVRGYEEFLMDMIGCPEIPDYILEQFCVKNIAIAQAAAAAGVDQLSIADDVANQNALMFSIDLWRAFIKSKWLRVTEAARAIKPDIEIWYHTDGNAMDIVDELLDIGITILNPVQPECMDPVEVKRRFGKRVIFDGTIGTQSTMPFGTPEEVRHVIRERKRTVGADGALILSPTHVLEPEVPLANIEAFFDECAKPER